MVQWVKCPLIACHFQETTSNGNKQNEVHALMTRVVLKLLEITKKKTKWHILMKHLMTAVHRWSELSEEDRLSIYL